MSSRTADFGKNDAKQVRHREIVGWAFSPTIKDPESSSG